VRRLFTTFDAFGVDLSMHALRWGVRAGSWTRIVRSVYGEGPKPPTALDRERAVVLARRTTARGALAGVLLELDSVRIDGRPTRARQVDVGSVVHGIPCATALQTLIDLAATLDDDRWEQALESALRKGLVTIEEIEAVLPRLELERLPGTPRICRVLARRPPGAPPTESLLETITVQVARTVPGLERLVRQHEVWHGGLFVARLDLCEPDLGVFFELDGQHHKDQPVYDASRQTAVVAVTGWLPGRFTWTEMTRTPRSSARRMGGVVEQARRRRAA
jgi:very-short-patch-repair endonuclease